MRNTQFSKQLEDHWVKKTTTMLVRVRWIISFCTLFRNLMFQGPAQGPARQAQFTFSGPSPCAYGLSVSGSYSDVCVLVRGWYCCGAMSFKMTVTFFLFIKRKTFPSTLGDSDQGKVSPATAGSQVARPATAICVHPVWCCRRHHRFIMRRRLLLKNTKREELENLFLVCTCFIQSYILDLCSPNTRGILKPHSK